MHRVITKYATQVSYVTVFQRFGLNVQCEYVSGNRNTGKGKKVQVMLCTNLYRSDAKMKLRARQASVAKLTESLKSSEAIDIH